MEEGLGCLSIYSIAQDAEGFLWTGTEDGLYRYDGRHHVRWGHGLKANIIWEVATGVGGGLWVNTDDGIFRLEGREFQPVAGLPRLRAGFLALGPGDSALAALGSQVFGRPGPEPMKVLRDLPGQIASGWASPDLHTLYLVTEDRLWRLEGGSWSDLALPRDFHGTGSKVFQDRAGRVFLRNRSNLWRMDAWSAAWVDLSAKLPGNIFNTFPPVEDALGRIWVGTSKGLVCFDGDQSWILDGSKGLPGGWAGFTFVDREGSLWVGSEGIHKLRGRFLWTNFSRREGLPSPSIWDIGRSLDGRVFACTDHGVAVLKDETWSVLAGTEGRTLLAGGGDGREAFWFGGSAKEEAWNAVFRVDLHTGRTEKILVKPVKPTDLVLAISRDARDGVYLGTRNSGVFHVHRENSRWITDPLPFPGQAPEERINSLRKDLQGGLWAAGSHGLFVLEKGVWTRLGTADGLLGDNCASLARDPKGSIWVSYLDARGISRVARVNGTWKVVESLTRPEALFKDAISSMLFDNAGVLWLGTTGGMKRWDGTTLDTFSREEGLASLDPSANSITVDMDGGIWQGFSNGLSYFQPRGYKGPPAPPVSRILEVRDGMDKLVQEDGARIPYQARTVSFQFSAVSFLAETRVIHEVRLVGLENDWRETRVGEARYPALPYGTYRFEVRSRLGDGQPGPASLFSFTIATPWWSSWWFRTASVLAALAGVLFLLRRRTAQLYRRNLDLERMVAARTEALEASKIDLEKANRALEEATLVDPLTGLHNRRFLDLSLPMDARQAQRAFREAVDSGADPLTLREDIILFLLDIDHFKTVNDSHGHLAGDLVLKQLAQTLQDSIRATDSLVRWGGEEFLMVARRTRRVGAPAIARSLLEVMRNQVFQLPGGVELQKTVSIGYCALPIHPLQPEAGDWQQALKMADQCLYAAKNTGRDRYVGITMPATTDVGALEGLKSWDVDWALERGLMVAECSEPGFRWPESR